MKKPEQKRPGPVYSNDPPLPKWNWTYYDLPYSRACARHARVLVSYQNVRT